MVRAVLLLLVLAGHQANGWGLDWFDEKDTMTRVKENGYPCEKHYVTTEDGFILTMYRIPYGKNSSSSDGKSRPAVILQHGILCSSECWAVGDPSSAMAYLLAENGYDVWLPNSRGTTYSRNHTHLTIKDNAFWDYSIHEMGIYDLPAGIDYILRETKQEKLSYIGHSQGTSIFFIMASSLPEYAAKVNVANAMAPVVYLDHTAGVIKAIGRVSKFLERAASFLGLQYVLDKRSAYKVFCNLPLGTTICTDLVFLISGFDSPYLDDNIVREASGFCPTGVSIKDLKHFGQWTRNEGKFTKFDYGTDNMKYYNSTNPPEYELSNITCPVVLFYSCNDYIATCPEVNRLAAKIPTLVEAYEIPYKNFSHVDFMWATNAKEVLTTELLRVLKMYN